MRPDTEVGPRHDNPGAPGSSDDDQIANHGAILAETADVSLKYLDVPTKGVAPKGFAEYRPHTKTRPTVDRILALYDQMRAADALPVGPRAVGYRLKENYVGEYTKVDFPKVQDIIKRLQQAGRLDWSWVADNASVTHEVDGWDGPAAFLDRAIECFYHRDRRAGQPTVVEIYAEARETTSLIRRLSDERGVTVYSGGGSCGPNIARKVACRALARAIEHGQSTVLLGICDFDQAGIRNVLRPHIEHVQAFLYGNDVSKHVLAIKNGDGDLVDMSEAGAGVSFRHLGLTPEIALDLVETDPDRDRIGDYIASGHDIWSRDVNLLDGVQKIELEALDPIVLRDRVVASIESIIDTEQLRSVVDAESSETAELKSCLSEISQRWS